jgi:hypothetical protein
MENTKKQTAVEWVIEQLTPAISLRQKYIDEIKSQAKQMEKEQIIEANEAGFNDAQLIDYKYEGKNPEDYYNETYNTESDGK